MKQEIERKFLVARDDWKAGVTATQRIRQGYLCLDPERTVRVRQSGDQAWLTIKGASDGPGRAEFEYPLPPAEATQLLDHLCLRPQIDKTRHLVPHGGRIFEVDVFHGDNEGLIMAEVELDDAAAEVDRAHPRFIDLLGGTESAAVRSGAMGIDPDGTAPQRGRCRPSQADCHQSMNCGCAQVDLPAWIGVEVTGDPRYFNAYLVQQPYRTWKT